MRYFLDTNIFLRYFVKEKDLKQHNECVDLIRLINNRKIKVATSHLVLAEIVWTLRSYYKVKGNKIVSSVRSIENLPNLIISDKYQTTVAHDLYSEGNAKYIDCLISSTPEISNKEWIVVSYDKDFDKLGVKRKEPKDLV